LETQNLRLRELAAADSPAVFRIFSDPEVTRYYDFDTFSTSEQASDLIHRQAQRFERGEALRWGITQTADNIVIGTIGLIVNQSNATGGLGYDLGQPYWRHGIMSEALSIVIRYGIRSVNLNRLQALVMPGNEASAKLLAKLGFTEEGTLRQYAFFKGRYQDLRCFSLLREDV
jgi:ribosomal-protein-alanine N-acetyltransferase